ncbi:DMT family transporter [Burkholderia cenocepacia]|uniref:DMT family transporter n=1 Tax=Burkholderia cenocepacia TaxID=95486 RepID=UPI00265563B0|nr:DMT family transporter [Burkholderia cenocepacia]MDN7631400.1 DMT family transporter [Burkholderia cenocepacia]
MTHLPLRGIIFCLIPPLLWGGMFPVAHHLAPSVNMFAMTLIRYSAVALILVPVLLLIEGGRAFQLEGKGLKLLLLGSAGFAGFGVSAFVALGYTSSTNVSLVMAMMPAIGAVLAAMASRKFPPIYTVVAILIAFIGVSLALTNGDYGNLISARDALGEFLALLGAICWVLYTRGAANVPRWSALRYTTVTTVLSIPAIIGANLVASAVGYVETPSLATILAGWRELAYLAVLAGVVAILSWNQGNKMIGPLNGTLFINLVPITTFTITIIMTGTLPTLAATVGGLLVIGGLLLNNMMTRRALKMAAQTNQVKS